MVHTRAIPIEEDHVKTIARTLSMYSSSLDARFWGVLAVVAFGAFIRLIPHPPNFSPIAAMALFGGAYFARKGWAILLPLLAMLVSDLALGFHPLMPAVYLSFVLIGCLGVSLSKNRSPVRIGMTSFAGSMLFFLVTNFAYWAQSGGLYPKTFAGLLACYTAALPFLQNSVAGDLVYSSVMFGAFALAEKTFSQLQPAR